MAKNYKPVKPSSGDLSTKDKVAVVLGVVGVFLLIFVVGAGIEGYLLSLCLMWLFHFSLVWWKCAIVAVVINAMFAGSRSSS